MPVAGYKAQVVNTGTSTAMSEEACSVVAGTSNETWEIDAGAKDGWDHTQTFTVEASEDAGLSWTTLGASEFSLSYLIGRVDLDAYTSLSGTVANVDAVRVSGQYLPKHDWLRGESITFSLPVAELMPNVFRNEGEERHYGRQDFLADVDGLTRTWTPSDGVGGSEDPIAKKLQDETPFMLEIQPDDDSTKVIRAWVKVFGLSGDYSGGSLNTDTVSMQGTQPTAAMSTQSARLWNYKA